MKTSQRVHQLVFDYLLALDDKLRVIGGLASHREQPNPLTYLVHLRKGVRFHDGHELTAADVVHTFGSFIDPAFVSPRKGAYRSSIASRPSIRTRCASRSRNRSARFRFSW